MYKIENGAYNLETLYRTDIVRKNNDYNDLGNAVVATYKTYFDVERVVAPYIAKYADDGFILTKDWIQERSRNFGMNRIMHAKMMEGVERFFLKNHGKRRLPSPHIISHRSVHYLEGMFTIEPDNLQNYLNDTVDRIRNFKVKSVHKISIDGLDPIYVENMRPGHYKYLMLRPKLGKSGTPSVDKWEVLLSTENSGYMIDHIDTDKNPRYNGTL